MVGGAQQTYVQLESEGRIYDFLIDTGACVSLIKQSLLSKNDQIDYENVMNVIGISGQAFQTVGLVNKKFESKNFHGSLSFQVIPDVGSLRTDGILGADFFYEYDVDICYSKNALFLNKVRARIPILRCDTVLSQSLPPYSMCYVEVVTKHRQTVYIKSKYFNRNVYLVENVQTPKNNTLTLTFCNESAHTYDVLNFKPDLEIFHEEEYDIASFSASTGDIELLVGMVNYLSADDVNFVKQQIFHEFESIFSDKNDTSPAKVESQKFFLKPFTTPRYVRQYRLPPRYREVISTKVKKMVEQKLAEPSFSSWNAPVLLVPKKGAKTIDDYRLVIDYRKLNDVIEDDKFPIPDINEILDGLGRAKYFSTLDLDQGYYQVPLHEKSRPYTAFTTPDGRFQLTRLPMGLKVSPAIFSRLMMFILGDFIGKICYVYLDDIIVYGNSLQEHAQNLRKVLLRLRDIGCKINFKKCSFFQDSVSFLGHLVSSEGLKPDPAKYVVIEKWPVPKNVKETQSFLGLVNYYRRFMKNFAKIAKPLYELTKKDVKFEWSSECQKAFDELKRLVMSPPTLAYPDFSQPFIVQTDASETGVGAVLMNHDRRPVAFLSKVLNKTQSTYHITDKELFAIVFALKKWSNYLLGQKFLVQTDHKALEQLFKMKEPNSRLTRYRLLIEQYDFDIQYLKGDKNNVADALSRVSLNVNDLKNMSVNVLTRFQKRKLEENLKTSIDGNDDLRKNDEDTGAPQIMKILRKQIDVPLLKFCTDLRSTPEVATEQVIVDKNYLVGYFPKLGELYLVLPVSLPSDQLENVLHNVKIAFWEVIRLSKRKEFCIFDDEIEKLGQDYRKILKIIGRKDYEKIKFYIVKHVKYVKDERVRKEILDNLHKLPTGGHFGVEKMVKTLKLNYFWPGMVEQVKTLVRSCEQCQTKKHSMIPKSPLSITDTASETFDRIHMDLAQFPESHSGNQYVLTVQDDLSKFMWCFPLPDKSAYTVARVLVEKLFLPYHFPKFLVSDCGREFENEVQKSVCNLLKIKHVTSAPYHHQSMGAIENSHKALNNYIRTFAEEDKYNWDLWLPYFSFAYNSTVHLATGYAPFELMFGKNNLLPDGTLQKLSEPCYDYDEYLSELKFRLRLALQDAKSLQISNKKKRKLCYDRKYETKTKEYVTGDFILLKNEAGNKLENVYRGPYEVTKVDDKNLFIKIGGRVRKVHVDNVKPYYTVLQYWLDKH